MGWASGSAIAESVWDSVRKHIPKDKRQKVAREIVEVFESEDCDTMDEARRLMKDAGLENRGED